MGGEPNFRLLAAGVPGSDRPVFGRERRAAWGRPCLYRRDERGHAYHGSCQPWALYGKPRLSWGSNSPLQVIGPGILVFAIGAERTHVSRRVVDQAMSNHLVLALESFSALAPRTPLNGAVVRTGGRMDIGMRVEQILCLEWRSSTSVESAHERARLGVRHAVDAHPIHNRSSRGRC